MNTTPRHRVVVVGGGFAGLQAVRGLRRAPVEVTLVDRQNYMLFQPLVYQVATGGLSPAEIAMPLRSILKRQRNARVLLAEVTGFDLERRAGRARAPSESRGTSSPPATTRSSSPAAPATPTSVTTSGKTHAPELKSLAGALDIRSRILAAFEAAEVEPDPARRRGWLTFVVVGGGPTGVEMAGQIAELAHDVLRARLPFGRHTDRARAARRSRRPRADDLSRVALAEGGTRARAAGRHAARRSHGGRRARRLGRDPETGTARSSRSPHARRVWAAGVTASDLARKLADGAGLDVDRAGRLTVEPDLTLPGAPRGARARRHGQGAGLRRDGHAAPGSGPGRDAAGTLRRPCRSATAYGPGRRARSATSTRATSPRSGDRRRSPT